MGSTPTHRMGFCHISAEAALTRCYSNALQTVLLSIALLCVMGIICSLTTKFLHRIVLWFAPINSKWGIATSFQRRMLRNSLSSCIRRHLHRTPNPDARKAERYVGFHTCYRRFWLGQQRLFFSFGVCFSLGQKQHSRTMLIASQLPSRGLDDD